MAGRLSKTTLERRRESFDRWQLAHPWIGFPLAVQQKYADDEGFALAAAITYYAFFSIFPLLLVLVSGLGFVLHHHPHIERSIVRSALGQFPVVGSQLKTHSLRGSGAGLALGLVLSLWSGTAVCRALENALDTIWDVPRAQRPGFVATRLRALLVLAVLGLGVLASTFLSGVGTVGGQLGVVWKVLAVLLSTLLDFGLFWVAFRTLSTRRQSWRVVRGGAAAAAVGYELLQLGGGVYVAHVLRGAGNAYGTFALVIGLLSWVYLATHVTLLAAEGNVVAARRLWPRSLFSTKPPAKNRPSAR
jgi:membrane protein